MKIGEMKNLKDKLTIVIPIKIDHEDRLRNVTFAKSITVSISLLRRMSSLTNLS